MSAVQKKNKKTFKSRNITNDILTYNDSNITQTKYYIITKNETENKMFGQKVERISSAGS